MNKIVRVVMDGGTPLSVSYQAGMTAGSAVASAGGVLEDGKTLAVDGRRATADTPVRPGSTVSRQPMARNG